jgi:hypothetical protein
MAPVLPPFVAASTLSLSLDIWARDYLARPRFRPARSKGIMVGLGAALTGRSGLATAGPNLLCFHLPASLGSTGVTPLRRYYGGSVTFRARFFGLYLQP